MYYRKKPQTFNQSLSQTYSIKNNNYNYLKTSWYISTLWTLLSISLSILSTFSFIQPDWLIKREIIFLSPIVSTDTSSNDQISYLNIYHSYRNISNLNNISTRTSYLNGTDMSYRQNILSESSFSKNNFSEPENLKKVVRSNESEILTSFKFGLIGFCKLNRCQVYESDSNNNIPQLWPILALIGGGGCITLSVSSILCFLALALPTSHLRHEVAKTLSYFQTAAVVLLMTTVVFFPLSLSHALIENNCGGVGGCGIFSCGECEMGWAYALSFVSALLSIYCPLLAKFTTEAKIRHRKKYRENYV